MDTNIVGRFHMNAAEVSQDDKAGRTEHNGKIGGKRHGKGLADFIPRHMYEQIDFGSTYVNTLTPRNPTAPGFRWWWRMTGPYFRHVSSCAEKIKKEEIRMVIIPDTKHLEEIYMSGSRYRCCLRPIRVESGFMEVL